MIEAIYIYVAIALEINEVKMCSMLGTPIF